MKKKGQFRNKVGPMDKYYPSAQKYAKLITDGSCHCGCNLTWEIIWSYEHSDGWRVEEVPEFQWLWIKCPDCGYEMSIWKLGVPRDADLKDVKDK